MSKILVEVRSVYGREAIYPANVAAAIFAQLTRKKTLDRVDLQRIQELGFEVEAKAPELVI